ncbi:MAG: DUF2851 family protein [Ignavibacteriales bacterium]|nr:DUF2851 family protein [Ignavibacteriales bacterium]
MDSKSATLEKFLYEIWKSQKFNKPLMTKDGEQIEVINCGEENRELAGPDFKNAKIKIGNLTYTGDVEIDKSYTDWKSHKHHINNRYNRVILHATLQAEKKLYYVITQDGRKVQSICFEDFLEDSIKNKIQEAIVNERNFRLDKMPCIEDNSFLSESEKLDFLYRLGLERFKSKCVKHINRLKEIVYIKEMHIKEPVIRYNLDEEFFQKTFTHEDFADKSDWEQLLYESIFEALGYSKNKDIMIRLARAFPLSIIRNFSSSPFFIEIIQTALFKVSGLIPQTYEMPDESSSVYFRKIEEHWDSIKLQYDGQIFNEDQWHFFKLRPQNFPTIRLAGGAEIVKRIISENYFSRIISIVEHVHSNKQIASNLRELVIVKADGFWREHYVFNKPAKVPINYFIGLSRADEIIVNVILPILSSYFEIFGKKDLSEKVIKIFSNYFQGSDNHLVDEVANTLKLTDASKRTILHQGMIELFRNYCSKQKCPLCEIGKQVF